MSSEKWQVMMSPQADKATARMVRYQPQTCPASWDRAEGARAAVIRTRNDTE
jgi:hypothetical protein